MCCMDKAVVQKNDVYKKVNWRRKSFLLVPLFVFAMVLFCASPAKGQGWPDIKIRLLPDLCFAVVEQDVGEIIRHCPHHDINGKLDAEQMIFTLGTVERETWLNPKNEIRARKHLEKHYDRLRKRAEKQGIQAPVNINKATLMELVALPQIGPVLAVKIVEYREIHGLFMTVEDIQKVEGIGKGKFNAIRYYISVK